MEPRLKYRDIPWSVAFGVLPGKIIGCAIIKPCQRLKYSWKRKVKRLLWRLLWVVILIVLVGIIGLLLEVMTEGDVSARLSETWAWWQELVS